MKRSMQYLSCINEGTTYASLGGQKSTNNQYMHTFVLFAGGSIFPNIVVKIRLQKISLLQGFLKKGLTYLNIVLWHLF